MTRILTFFGLLALSLLALTMTLGLSLGDHQAAMLELRKVNAELQTAERWFSSDESRVAELRQRRAELQQAEHWGQVHVLFGIASSLVVVLVNSIVVTYFIGTSRWCKEVVETYRLDPIWAEQSTALKRRTFPWTLMSMLTVIGIAALGGGADTSLDPDAAWATWHLASALGGTALIGWVFYVQWLNVAENHEVIERIMRQVEGEGKTEAARAGNA